MYAQNNGYYMPNYNPYMQQGNGAMPDTLNQYKGQYQQMPMQQNVPAQQMQMPIPPTPQKPSNELIWVQGLEGAKGFLVAPNNTVVLWDTENPVIYVKSADASGIPSMRVLDFKERNGNSQNNNENNLTTHKCTCGDKFATKEQINELQGKIDDLTAKYEQIVNVPVEKSKTTAKKTKEAE